MEELTRKQRIDDWITLHTPVWPWLVANRIRHFWRRWTKKQIRWEYSLKPGDMVCNCSGQHLLVTKIIKKGNYVELQGGGRFDPGPCLAPVAEDGSCHSVYDEHGET